MSFERKCNPYVSNTLAFNISTMLCNNFCHARRSLEPGFSFLTLSLEIRICKFVLRQEENEIGEGKNILFLFDKIEKDSLAKQSLLSRRSPGHVAFTPTLLTGRITLYLPWPRSAPVDSHHSRIIIYQSPL